MVINLDRVELGDHTKLLHNLDLTLVQQQHVYRDKFTNLEASRNLIVSFTNINDRLASVQKGIAHIQIDVDKIYTYLSMLATYTVSSLLLPSLTLRES